MTMVVIGVGMVGTSIALAARRAGHRVHLRDRNTSHALVAAGLGAGSVDPVSPDEVDLVVVAVPPDHCARVIADSLLEHRSATVTDVASVKGALIGQLRALVDDEALRRYVGSHPMAGSHRSGPVSGDADLFVDRTWVLTPHRVNPDVDVARVRRLATESGAVVTDMDPYDHDRAVAAVSHLPHVASVLVADQMDDVPAEHLRLAGQGLRDVTRIAGSDPGLWVQILSANAAAVRPRLERLRTAVDALLAGFDDRQRLVGALQAGVAGTARIPGKHGLADQVWSEVVVEIPDTPGALAKLFAEVGEAGINIEDMSIEHDQNRQVGHLALLVDSVHESELRDQLAEHGWTVRP